MEVISWIIGLLLSWYVWLPVVLILGYLTYRNYRRIDAVKAIESTLLILEIPKANDKSEMAAEQLFASLHGILRDKEELKINGGIQEHFKALSKAKFMHNTQQCRFMKPTKTTLHTNGTIASPTLVKLSRPTVNSYRLKHSKISKSTH